MNQIELLCSRLSAELSSMRCPDCGGFHRVSVSHQAGESLLSPSFPTLFVGPDANASVCPHFVAKVQAITVAERTALLKRNGLLLDLNAPEM